MIKTVGKIALFLSAVVLLSSCAGRKKTSASQLTFQQKSLFDKYYFEAIKLKVLGDYTGAATQFADALKVDPNSHAAMYQMANLNMAQRNFHEAVYWAERSVKYAPDFNFWYYGQLAQAYNKVAEFKKSAETFVKMIDAEPGRRTNYIEAGNQFINAKELKSALQIINKYEDKFGVDEESAQKKSEILFALGKSSDAIQAIQKLVKAYPGEVNYMGLLAEAYMRINNFTEAEKWYKEVLKIESSNGLAYFGLAEIARNKEQNEESFNYMKRAFEDPNLSVSLKVQVLGSYYRFINLNPDMKKEALALCKTLIETHPTEPEVYMINGDMYYAAGFPDTARLSLLNAVELDPANVEIWRKIISIDDEQDDYQKMKEDSRNALELFPNHPFLYIINAYANLYLEDYNSVIEVANAGLEICVLNQDRVDLLSTLADACNSLGKYAESDQAFDELLEIDPENHLALNNYAYYLSLRGSSLDKALAMITKALALQPTQATYVDTHGWVLYQLGRYEEAEKVLKIAYEKMSGEAEVVEHYATVLIKNGKVEAGNELMKKANELKSSQNGNNQP
ncbi:MAG: tetratricopeptide repeat protein [Bacteroidetes bacterium]|nr:tetratricopeptide repeat protein [Bacteroidota bacterium]